MNRYKLINITTKEETICDKVTIEGFDYYVSDETPKKEGQKCYSYYINELVMFGLPHTIGCKKVIATNNPNIDIPKVIDEVEKLAELRYKTIGFIEEWRELEENNPKNEGFIEGYNKAKETYQFTEQDMIEFTKFYNSYKEMIKTEQWEIIESSCEDVLKVWKSQQPITIYYE